MASCTTRMIQTYEALRADPTLLHPAWALAIYDPADARAAAERPVGDDAPTYPYAVQLAWAAMNHPMNPPFMMPSTSHPEPDFTTWPTDFPLADMHRPHLTWWGQLDGFIVNQHPRTKNLNVTWTCPKQDLALLAMQELQVAHGLGRTDALMTLIYCPNSFDFDDVFPPEAPIDQLSLMMVPEHDCNHSDQPRQYGSTQPPRILNWMD